MRLSAGRRGHKVDHAQSTVDEWRLRSSRWKGSSFSIIPHSLPLKSHIVQSEHQGSFVRRMDCGDSVH